MLVILIAAVALLLLPQLIHLSRCRCSQTKIGKMRLFVFKAYPVEPVEIGRNYVLH